MLLVFQSIVVQLTRPT